MSAAVNYSYPLTFALLLLTCLLSAAQALPQFAEQSDVGDEFLESVGQPDVETSAGDMSTEVPESWDLRDCFTSHHDCPNENVTFHLYTRERADDPYELKFDEENLNAAPFAKNRPIKFLIHGYTGNRNFAPNSEIRPAFFEHGEYNVISVDWGKLARSPCYVQATYNVEAAGKCTALLIEVLVKNHEMPMKNIHVIGFSLGAQVTGQVAKYLRDRGMGKLRRITGLDPAMPLFATLSRGAILDRSDAHFVDIVHTNAGNKGKLGPNGHVDFYVNGGAQQPGCQGREVYDSASCSHGRAPIYYAESINSQTGFWGKECRSWLTYRSGLCDWHTNSTALMGEYANPRIHGQFFLDSNSRPPFALGIEFLYGENSASNTSRTLEN